MHEITIDNDEFAYRIHLTGEGRFIVLNALELHHAVSAYYEEHPSASDLAVSDAVAVGKAIASSAPDDVSDAEIYRAVLTVLVRLNQVGKEHEPSPISRPNTASSSASPTTPAAAAP